MVKQLFILLMLGTANVSTASKLNWFWGSTKVGVYNSWHNPDGQWEARWVYARAYDLKKGIKFYHNSPYQVPGIAAIPANAGVWDVADALYYKAGLDAQVYYYQKDMNLSFGDIVVSKNSDESLSWYTIESGAFWRISENKPTPHRKVAFWTPRDANRKERLGVIPNATYVISSVPPEKVIYPTNEMVYPTNSGIFESLWCH